MTFSVVDKSGELLRTESFDAPYAAMVHDFVVTRDHVIFPIMPWPAVWNVRLRAVWFTHGSPKRAPTSV